MNPNTLLWSYLGVLFFLLVLVTVVVLLIWDRAEDTGKAKGRGEMVQECAKKVEIVVRQNADLVAENRQLMARLAHTQQNQLSGRALPQLGPGVEYSESRKWKGLPAPAGEGAE